MNSRTLRRLATDHGALHNQPLPPNYLFPPGNHDTDDLTQLDILLAGPTHTPYQGGVWRLHLNIPNDYPQQPPTANFRTPIFHPNVEPQTGGVCVETLKRDWDTKLTLRDVLITISCLLIQPNPDSALNADAGSLIQDNYEAFASRAELMTSIHAAIPKALKNAVLEAQMRGQETTEKSQESEERAAQPAAPMRRRRTTARQSGTTSVRRSDGSPSGGVARRRPRPEPTNPFATAPRADDVFGAVTLAPAAEDNASCHDDNSSMLIDADQENDALRSPQKAATPKASTPRRPPGAPVPLGELTLDDASSSDSDLEDSMEAEYPPSPRKRDSPNKSPAKAPHQHHIPPAPRLVRAESSRAAAARKTTPTTNPFTQPLAHDSPYHMADPMTSPRKAQTRMLQETPLLRESPKRAPLFPQLHTPREYTGIFKQQSPSSSEKKEQERQRREELNEKLWAACGNDVVRWNRGDFDGEPFAMKAKRW